MSRRQQNTERAEFEMANRIHIAIEIYSTTTLRYFAIASSLERVLILRI
jgi:hypothetical protein